MVGITRQDSSNKGVIQQTPLKVLLEMAVLPARRIESPSLTFGNGTLSGRDTARGQWNLQGRKFLGSPSGATKFTVLVLKRKSEPNIRNLQEFKDGLQTGMRTYCGINEQYTQVSGVADALDWPHEGQVDWLKSLFTHCGKSSGVCYCFVITSDSTWYKVISYHHICVF